MSNYIIFKGHHIITTLWQWAVHLFQRDSTIAKLLFSSLFSAIFERLYSEKLESEIKDITDKLGEYLTNMLASSVQYNPPFIGCVLVSINLVISRLLDYYYEQMNKLMNKLMNKWITEWMNDWIHILPMKPKC